MLLEARDIETEYVAGYTLSKEQVYIDHAWTIVKLKGNWFHLDPQLEQNIISNGTIKYRFFMKTDEEMLRDHKWGENLVEYWPNIPLEESENIINNFTYPACNTKYPEQNTEKIRVSPPPDYNALYSEIDEIKRTKNLKPIALNVEPPILVEEHHITPPLLAEVISEKQLYGKSSLDEAEEALYDRIATQLRLHNISEFQPGSMISNEDVAYTIRQVINDNPELYWAKIDYDYLSNNISLRYKNGYTKERIVEELSELEEETKKIIAQYNGKSDFEKALFAHDYLCENVYYDSGYKGTDSDNPYGAIIGNVAYCDGYARGFQHLASTLGLENIYIAGWNTKSTTHAWNAVKLDGEWYYIDTTWDRSSNSYGGAYHDFFAMTFEDCFSARVWDDSQYLELPKSQSTENNFFVKLDYTLNDEDFSSITAQRKRIAEIANSQLIKKTNLKLDYSYAFVEFKILTDPKNYLAVKNTITKELFYILEEMQAQAEENNYNFSVSDNTEVSCYFNDSLQVVAFYPKVKTN